MAEPPALDVKENRFLKGVFAVAGIMSTLVIYGVLQEKIMRVPYGPEKEFFKYSLFLVFWNRITTCAVSAGFLLASKKVVDPVAPVYTYCIVSVSNILTTTCQYEALKYVSFPVQTLAKCAKMIPVMIWGTAIMQKKYKGHDYLVALLVTVGCSLFILYPVQSQLDKSNGIFAGWNGSCSAFDCWRDLFINNNLWRLITSWSWFALYESLSYFVTMREQ